jgi:uncharacterized membrane protein YkvA (DUF1232 family)
MADKPKDVANPQKQVGMIVGAFNTLRLVWRLFWDRRVPRLPKLMMIGAVVYAVSPLDFVPDILIGFGQMDDLGVFLLACYLFLEMCPEEVVAEHRRAIFGAPPATAPNTSTKDEADVVEGVFHEVKD